MIRLVDRTLGRNGRSHLGKKRAIVLGEEMGDRALGRNGRSLNVRQATKIELILKSRVQEKNL
ncbi:MULTISPECIES: hypothetical protein [unclassified Microcoleus]|uniref:hypothetical protein n=1 Tax=unclassified Microcoleus TaxID=2642155 RepID=UPI002FD4FB0A